MAKPPFTAPPSILTETEKLLTQLVSEANTPTAVEDGGPDFSDRLKVVDAVSRFLVVKHKLVPPDKANSEFEEMMSGLYSGESSSRTGTAPKGGKGHRVPAVVGDDDDGI